MKKISKWFVLLFLSVSISVFADKKDDKKNKGNEPVIDKLADDKKPSNNLFRNITKYGYDGLQGIWYGIDGLADGLNTAYVNWIKIPEVILISLGLKAPKKNEDKKK